MTRFSFASVTVLAAVSCARGRPPGAEQQPGSIAEYPVHPVRLVEPFGAGGGPDVIARTISPKLSALWGQPVLVENLPGAGSTAAPAFVAKSPPDGHTLLVNTSAHAYSAALVRNLPYDPLNDFIPIAPLTRQPYVLVARRDAGFRTLSQLIATASRAPGRLRFASTGLGTGTHVGVETLNLEAGIQALHVPARAGEAIADVIAATIAGRADYQMVPIEIALADIREGRLVALGVSGARRSSLLPEIPTIAEAGVAGFDFQIWYGVWAPAGTPGAVIATLARDIGRVMEDPELRAALARHGAEPMAMTQPEFAHFVQSETGRASKLVRAAPMRSP